MSLRQSTVNSLNVLGARKVKFMPQHFHKFQLKNRIINESYNSKIIEHWISNNLNSRYSIEETMKLNPENKIVTVIEIGFEDANDLTMFLISCPHIQKG